MLANSWLVFLVIARFPVPSISPPFPVFSFLQNEKKLDGLWYSAIIAENLRAILYWKFRKKREHICTFLSNLTPEIPRCLIIPTPEIPRCLRIPTPEMLRCLRICTNSGDTKVSENIPTPEIPRCLIIPTPESLKQPLLS